MQVTVTFQIYAIAPFQQNVVNQVLFLYKNSLLTTGYADDVNILGGSIHTLKENAESLVAATREIGLEVSADKTKYMVMSRDQNAGQNHSVRIDNSIFERVEEFKYLGTTLTIQNSIREEIKSRLRSGNACYHLVQNLLTSRLLSRKLKIKIYRTVILPVVLYGCEAWS